MKGQKDKDTRKKGKMAEKITMGNISPIIEDQLGQLLLSHTFGINFYLIFKFGFLDLDFGFSVQ